MACSQSINLENSKEIFVDAEHGKLFCRIIGKGKPLVVLHGGPGLSQDYLLPQMAKLAENNLVIFYDQMGCGKSTGEINNETISINSYVNDLEAIRKSLGFEKISLLGHSWGGFVCAQYAISHAECVDKLILSNSIPFSLQDFSLFIAESIRRTKPIHSELMAIQLTIEYQDGDPKMIERHHRRIFRVYCHLPEKADLLNLRMSQTETVNGGRVHDILRENILDKPFDLYGPLKSLKISTLVIHGDTDPVPLISAQRTHECLQNSKIVVMKNCGHFPYVEDPDTYFKHIKDFLSEYP